MCPFCKKKCVTLLWHHELLVSIFVIRTFFLLKLKLLTRKKYCPLAPCKLLTAENVAFTLCHDVLRGNIRWWPTNSQQARTHYIYMHIASWFQPQLLYSEHFRSNELAWLCKLIAAVMCHLCYTSNKTPTISVVFKQQRTLLAVSSLFLRKWDFFSTFSSTTTSLPTVLQHLLTLKTFLTPLPSHDKLAWSGKNTNLGTFCC